MGAARRTSRCLLAGHLLPRAKCGRGWVLLPLRRHPRHSRSLRASTTHVWGVLLPFVASGVGPDPPEVVVDVVAVAAVALPMGMTLQSLVHPRNEGLVGT